MTGALEWQGRVGQNWAAEWERTDRSFAALTPHLLRAIAAEAGEAIVDIGCGAGELSLALAQARPNAHITGVDISEDLIRAARERSVGLTTLRFDVADASVWCPEQGPVDLFVSRHGVMFFNEPPAAFAHLSQIAAPGARFVFSCFRAATENTWIRKSVV